MSLSHKLTSLLLNNAKNIKNARAFSQKAYTDIIYERLQKDDSSIAVLGMNRPKARNAFSLNLLTEFEENLSIVEHDRDIRVLIIRSLAPGIFCAGIYDVEV